MKNNKVHQSQLVTPIQSRLREDGIDISQSSLKKVMSSIFDAIVHELTSGNDVGTQIGVFYTSLLNERKGKELPVNHPAYGVLSQDIPAHYVPRLRYSTKIKREVRLMPVVGE